MSIRVTPDTNVLVSSTIVKGSSFEILRLSKLGKIKLVLSLEIIKEFKEVISRPKFGFSEEQISNAVKQLISISEIIVSVTKIKIVKDDNDDNIILSTAIDGKAEYLVSGDPHLLKIKNFKSIKIVKPSNLLKIFYE